MELLLDTHTLIWYAENNERLPNYLVELISTAETCYISRVSLWEVAIKVGIRKMKVEPSYMEWLRAIQQQFQLLETTDRHLETLLILPLHHRDPFGRLLIAQAINKNLVLISRDEAFSQYPVRVQW
jgi:PIN domain nuclease of toxin-antitoxin system